MWHCVLMGEVMDVPAKETDINLTDNVALAVVPK